MSTRIKKIKSPKITIVKDLPDYSKDPVFIKKAEETSAIIKKYGVPERFKKKSK